MNQASRRESGARARRRVQPDRDLIGLRRLRHAQAGAGPAVARIAPPKRLYVRRYLTSFHLAAVSQVCAFLCIGIRRWAAISCRRSCASSAPRWSPPGAARPSFPIDTENITDEQLDRLEEFAVAAEASGRPLHAIVSTDGDLTGRW